MAQLHDARQTLFQKVKRWILSPSRGVKGLSLRIVFSRLRCIWQARGPVGRYVAVRNPESFVVSLLALSLLSKE
jgi:hypothetical protein